MKTHLHALLIVAALAIVTTTVVAGDSDEKKPYAAGSSYTVVFSPVVQAAGAELPTGIVTVVEGSGDWIKIKYTTSKNERSKSNPGDVVAVETAHTAWINLDHVVALLEPAKAD